MPTVDSQGICLDDAATTVYALQNFSFARGVWVVDVATSTVSFLSVPVLEGYALGSRIQIHNGKLWVPEYASGNARENTHIFQIDAISGVARVFDLAGDGFSRIDDLAIAGGTVYVVGVSWTTVLRGTTNVSSTVIVDTSVNFVTAGVTTSKVFFVQNLTQGFAVKIASVDGPHQITLATTPLATGTLEYEIITPVSLGSAPDCGDTVLNVQVVGNYDPITGGGAAVAVADGVPGSSDAQSPRFTTVNRQTQELTVYDQLEWFGTLAGFTLTPSNVAPAPQPYYAIPADNGHIYASNYSFPTVTLEIYTSVADNSPTFSNPWPFAFPSGPFYAASLSGSLYALDGSGHLVQMVGDGPTLTSVGSIGPFISGSPSGNFGQAMIGDETNNGLWVGYTDRLVFWSASSQTVTANIPYVFPAPPPAIVGHFIAADGNHDQVYVDGLVSGVHTVQVFNAAGIYIRSIDASGITLGSVQAMVWVGADGTGTNVDKLVYWMGGTQFSTLEVISGTVATFDMSVVVSGRYAGENEDYTWQPNDGPYQITSPLTGVVGAQTRLIAWNDQVTPAPNGQLVAVNADGVTVFYQNPLFLPLPAHPDGAFWALASITQSVIWNYSTNSAGLVRGNEVDLAGFVGGIDVAHGGLYGGWELQFVNAPAGTLPPIYSAVAGGSNYTISGTGASASGAPGVITFTGLTGIVPGLVGYSITITNGTYTKGAFRITSTVGTTSVLTDNHLGPGGASLSGADPSNPNLSWVISYPQNQYCYALVNNGGSLVAEIYADWPKNALTTSNPWAGTLALPPLAYAYGDGTCVLWSVDASTGAHGTPYLLEGAGPAPRYGTNGDPTVAWTVTLTSGSAVDTSLVGQIPLPFDATQLALSTYSSTTTGRPAIYMLGNDGGGNSTLVRYEGPAAFGVNFGYSFVPNAVVLVVGDNVNFDIVTTFAGSPDTITGATILSGGFLGAVLTVSGLPGPAGTTFTATLTSTNPSAAPGNYTLLIQVTGLSSPPITQSLDVSLVPYDLVVNPQLWLLPQLQAGVYTYTDVPGSEIETGFNGALSLTEPFTLYFDPLRNEMWIGQFSTKSISVVFAPTQALIATIDLTPYVAADGTVRKIQSNASFVFATTTRDTNSYVLIISKHTHAVVGMLDTGHNPSGKVRDICFDGNGNLWVVSQSKDIQKFTTTDIGAALHGFPTPRTSSGGTFLTGTDPQSICYDAAHNHIFVGMRAGVPSLYQLTVLGVTLATFDSTPLSAFGNWISLLYYGGQVWAATDAASIVQINTATFAAGGSVVQNLFTVGQVSYDPVIDPTTHPVSILFGDQSSGEVVRYNYAGTGPAPERSVISPPSPWGALTPAIVYVAGPMPSIHAEIVYTSTFFEGAGPPAPGSDFDFSFSPNPVTVLVGTSSPLTVHALTVVAHPPDVIDSFSFVGGQYSGAGFIVSGLPLIAGFSSPATVSSSNPLANGGLYNILVQGIGEVAGARDEFLQVELVNRAEVTTAVHFFEGSDSLAPPPHRAEIVLTFGLGRLTTVYRMRASCSTAPGGHIYWENQTGDNANQPLCGGTLGPTFIIDSWDEAD